MTGSSGRTSRNTGAGFSWGALSRRLRLRCFPMDQEADHTPFFAQAGAVDVCEDSESDVALLIVS